MASQETLSNDESAPAHAMQPQEACFLGLPNPQATVDLIPEWSSKLPAHLGVVNAGFADLFADGRVTWALDQMGGAEGRSVFELGLLEGGHTYMLEEAGASEIKQSLSSERPVFSSGSTALVYLSDFG